MNNNNNTTNQIQLSNIANNQPLRLALGLALFSAPVACALAFSAALSTDSLISR
jgi:hypothetical protein